MPKIPDYQCHECGALYEQKTDAIGCCHFVKAEKANRKKRLRYSWSLWSKTGAGFGLGIWRVAYSQHEIIWTVAIGPLSVYLRYS